MFFILLRHTLKCLRFLNVIIINTIIYGTKRVCNVTCMKRMSTVRWACVEWSYVLKLVIEMSCVRKDISTKVHIFENVFL